MALIFDPLLKCIQTLDRSLVGLDSTEKGTIDYEVYRNSVVKSFELTLEMSGKSVKRALKEYMASPKLVQELTFKDIFRFAAQYGLIEDPSPWFEYQDSRNNTVHDYGENFADTVLKLIQRFYIDAVQLHLTLVQKHGV